MTLKDFELNQKAYIISNEYNNLIVNLCDVIKIGKKYITVLFQNNEFKFYDCDEDYLKEVDGMGHPKLLFNTLQSADLYIVNQKHRQYVNATASDFIKMSKLPDSIITQIYKILKSNEAYFIH